MMLCKEVQLNILFQTETQIVMAFNLYLVLMLLIKAGAFAVDGFVYNGSSMELNGVAEILDNGLLRLTGTSNFSVGRAFYKLPQRFKDSPDGKVHSFTTTFVFAIVPDKSRLNGQGMAFVIAPTIDNPAGMAAQYLGLFNATNNGDPSNHIVAVEFDTLQSAQFADFIYAKDHVGIDINSLVSAKAAPAGYFTDHGFKNLDLASGEPMQVWVEYDGETNQLDVTLSLLHKSKPDRPLLSYDFNISSIIFEQMYVGFSSSTGTIVQSHYVLGWSFQMNGKAQELDLSKLPSFPGEKRPKNRTAELAIAVSLSLVFLVVIIVSVSFLWRRSRRYFKFTEILEDWEVQSGSHRFSFEDLLMATKGFSEKELLGKGGFGKVYRGVLPVSSEQVAVKRISDDSKQGMKEFVAEIETLGQLRHKNLVRVLGYCRGKGELILVYEYMPNASLDKFLYSSNPEVVLNWNQRFKIISDVALALNYLHEEWIQIIIHRDIKASNVLLDGELNGKLGDFGLARCMKHAQDPLTTNVAGTLGYIAPELARGGKATTRTDIYAFGAFCLEVACGRRPVVQDAPPVEMILVDWVAECWKEGEILRAVDPKLDSDFNAEEVELVLKLGLVCSNNAAEARPKMSRILMYLRGDILLPDDLNANADEDEYAGNHESHAQHDCCSISSLPITESLAFVGR